MWDSSGFPVFDITQNSSSRAREMYTFAPDSSVFNSALSNRKLEQQVKLLQGVVEWPTAVRKWKEVIQAEEVIQVSLSTIAQRWLTSTDKHTLYVRVPAAPSQGFMMSSSSVSGSMSRANVFFPTRLKFCRTRPISIHVSMKVLVAQGNVKQWLSKSSSKRF